MLWDVYPATWAEQDHDDNRKADRGVDQFGDPDRAWSLSRV